MHCEQNNQIVIWELFCSSFSTNENNNNKIETNFLETKITATAVYDDAKRRFERRKNSFRLTRTFFINSIMVHLVDMPMPSIHIKYLPYIISFQPIIYLIVLCILSLQMA
jgi:hypothetical protein